MRTFEMPPITAAILFTVLFMGVLGFCVILPVITINWTWNSFIAPNTILPHIHMWQAILLYIAAACIAYLGGFVQIEFKAETVD